mgnify:FL=1|jgi:hypothetical protein
MQGISNRNTLNFQEMKDQNTKTFNRYKLEKKVQKRITVNVIKRLEGWDDIDDKYPNEVLVKRWMAVILALNNNEQDTNKTAWEIYNNKSLPYFGFTSIEDARALTRLVEGRFLEEIWSYSIFLNDCDGLSENEIMEKIEEPLSYVSSGDLNL